MPFKSEKIAINNEKLDKRVKLTKEQKVEIKEMYETGNYSYRILAEMFNVSKRTIQFIVNPEKYAIAKKQLAERQKDGRYYDKDKHSNYTKEHRRYKHELYKEGKIGEKAEK